LNISRALPSSRAVGRTSDELAYFKSLSERVLHGCEKPAEEHDLADNSVETWGLMAAVLGNASNRHAFQQTFWWHEECGFRVYLKAAKGDSVIREIRHPETGELLERRVPEIVLAEKPPSPQIAKANWRKARTRLLQLKNEVEQELQSLETLRLACLTIGRHRADLSAAEVAHASLVAHRATFDAAVRSRQTEATLAQFEHERREKQLRRNTDLRPGFFSRLFNTESWQQWSGAHTRLLEAEHQAGQFRRAAESALAEATKALRAHDRVLQKSEENLKARRQQVAELSQQLEGARQRLGERLVDDDFFSRGHEAWNLAAPWIPDALQRQREDLFIAALNVHRAFIDAAAQKVLHNLSILFSPAAMEADARRRLSGELWSTLFLVVPVVSTTFASVDRMLSDLPTEALGWLLIDEAGQALPQAAVGAIMRCRRSIVVGDPLQIPPIVSLPERLNSEICRYFGVDETSYTAPEASAQTLADRASPFQTTFASDFGPRSVGLPLLVHRRCGEPMFGISNRIAYDGLMVPVPTSKGTSPVGAVLGPSRWLDIEGEAESKWCPAEGEVVVSLVRRLASAGLTNPDVFVITPFRIVAHELKRRLERETEIFSGLSIDPAEWLHARIGTIHTVQGREAETVILVLGAPKASQAGARHWAAGTPNILNVAVSRAKLRLYVVGSHAAWEAVGYARELARSLPTAIRAGLPA
jgi:hypothetical protein